MPKHTIADIDLLRRIQKGQFNLGKPLLRPLSGMQCWWRPTTTPLGRLL